MGTKTVSGYEIRVKEKTDPDRKKDRKPHD